MYFLKMGRRQTNTRNNTYCPKLWTSIYIYKNGNVYNCCNRTHKIGNINSNRLEEIKKCKLLQKIRTESLLGRLTCYKHCNVIDKDRATQEYKDKQYLNQKFDNLTIMFGEACNINCVMCCQNSKSKKKIDYTILTKKIDLTSFNKGIMLTGGGPLYNKSAIKYFDYLILKGKKARFTTNGTLINNELAEKIACNCDEINISLNASKKSTHESINRGSKWDVVLDNINKVKNARDRLDTKLIIEGHMTIIIKNIEEIPLFIKESKKFGFDCVNFSCDYSVLVYLKLFPKKREQIRIEIKEIIDSNNFQSIVYLKTLNKLGLYNSQSPRIGVKHIVAMFFLININIRKFFNFLYYKK